MEYPYNAPIILTDNIFVAYGGETGTTNATQRAASYWLAEKQMTQYLSAFLLPTVYTGTYYYDANHAPVRLDFGYILQIYDVTFQAVNFWANCAVIDYVGSDAVRNAKYGLIDVAYAATRCPCMTGWLPPYRVRVSYLSGLTSGTSYQPDMLLSLTQAAQIQMNQIDHFSMDNEGAFDIGVQQFSAIGYSEVRMPLENNTFGNSAAANAIARRVKHLRAKPALRFHQ